MLVHAYVFVVVLLALQDSADYRRGVELFRKGDVTGALPLLAKAAQADPRNAQAWKALGVAYAADGQYSLAEHPLRVACELDASLEDACYYLARALYALNRFDSSIQIFRKLIPSDPKAWKLHLGAAQAMEAVQSPVEAEQEFQAALELAAGADPAPAVAYGLFLLRQGRSVEALKPLGEAVAHFPNSAEAHLQLARALEQEGKGEDAIQHLKLSLAIQPASAQAELLLGKAYARVGRTAEAEVHLKAAAVYEAGSVTVR